MSLAFPLSILAHSPYKGQTISATWHSLFLRTNGYNLHHDLVFGLGFAPW